MDRSRLQIQRLTIEWGDAGIQSGEPGGGEAVGKGLVFLPSNVRMNWSESQKPPSVTRSKLGPMSKP